MDNKDTISLKIKTDHHFLAQIKVPLYQIKQGMVGNLPLGILSRVETFPLMIT